MSSLVRITPVWVEKISTPSSWELLKRTSHSVVTRILTRSIESQCSCFPSPPFEISFLCTWHSSRFSPSLLYWVFFFPCLFSAITVLTLGNSALFRFVPFSAHFHLGGGRCCARHNSYFTFFFCSSGSQSAHFSLQRALFIWINVIVAAQIPGTGLGSRSP